MNTKKALTICVIFFLILSIKSQGFRVQYELNGLNINDSSKTMFNLDVTTEKSVFYSSILCKKDSLSSNLIIEKSNSEYNLYDKINGVPILVKLNKTIKWDILQETKIEDDIKMQKASTTYNGKKIIAWFSNDVDIYEGPYIFKGLPGLVFSIELVESKISFNLKSILPISETCNIDFKNPKILDYEKYIKLTKSQDDLNNALFKSFEKLNFPENGLKKLNEVNKDSNQLNFLRELL